MEFSGRTTAPPSPVEEVETLGLSSNFEQPDRKGFEVHGLWELRGVNLTCVLLVQVELTVNKMKKMKLEWTILAIGEDTTLLGSILD